MTAKSPAKSSKESGRPVPPVVPAVGAVVGMGGFAVRVLIVLLLVGLAFLLWRLRDALAVGLGSIVLGLGFRGLADALTKRTRLPAALALAVVVIGVLGALALSLQVFGSTLAAQFSVLSRRLPESLDSLESWLGAGAFGHDLLPQGRATLLSALAGAGPRFAAGLVGALGTTATYLLVMVASGVFLAIDPTRYRHGILMLIPRARRAHYDHVLSVLADALRRWLLGRLVVMLAVGVMSSLGLWALGIDAPVALGLTGAVLTFIPNLGSVMSALPGMLIAYQQEPIKAVAVAVLIWAVHFVEGTFITPYVQDEAVDVPPVISIFSTVVFALLLGPVGVFLTGPITVVVIVLIRHLYVEDVLGEHLEPRRRVRRFDFLRRATPPPTTPTTTTTI